MYKNQYFPIGRFLYIDLLALLCGMLGGGIAIWFLYIIKFFHGLIFGSQAFDLVNDFPWWRIILPLLLAGFVAGFISRFMRYKRPFGVAGVVETCALRNGHMPLKEGVLNALLHKITLSLGVSSGREGPAIHLASTILTPLLVKLRIDSHHHVLLMGCVAAGAIGASFNTALAGALFAWEVIVGRGRVQYILPLTIGGGGGLLLSYLFYGSEGLFYIPDFPALDMISSYWIYPAMAIFGVSTGVIGGCFVSLSTWIYDFLQSKNFPVMARTMLGATTLALVAVSFPYVLGVGYHNIYLQLFAEISVGAVVIILAVKLLASVITTSCGLGGGVWTLCLIFGGIYGTIGGHLFDSLTTSAVDHQALFMVVGMAGFITSILGAPITGILFVIEHNGQFEIVFACLIAVIFAAQTISIFFPHSFYSETLTREMGGGWMQSRDPKFQLAVHDLIEPADSICGEEKVDLAYKLLEDKDEQSILFVTDYHDERFIGVIGWQELSRYHHGEDKVCFDIMGIKRSALQVNDLQQVWELLNTNPDPALPVVDEGGKIIGCIKRTKILRAMRAQVKKR